MILWFFSVLPWKLHCKVIFFVGEGCEDFLLIGNGICNVETNNKKCLYDGGDCCGSCVNVDSCTECTCLDSGSSNEISNAKVGDGICHVETYTEECDYDGGDCKFHFMIQ